MSDEPKPDAPPVDVVLLHSPTQDGRGAQVVRLKGDDVSLGEVRPLEEGKAIHGEVVRLSPREGAPAFMRNVEILHEAKPVAHHGGPPQVATSAYRDNWETVFGSAERSLGLPN
jgi:hypothetical protein